MILADLSDWFVLFGRTHPLVIHLPIGMLFIAAFFETLDWWRNENIFSGALYWVWLFTSVTASIACIAGFVLVSEGAYEQDVVDVHQWLGVSVALVSIFMSVCYMRGLLVSWHRAIVSLLVLVLVALTGHFGGTLTHGADFFGTAVNAAFGFENSEAMEAPPKRTISNPAQVVVYPDLIQPILEQKCYSCHSSKKQKGKLRVDSYSYMLKGGKNDTSLVAGRPEESELYERLVLPKGNKQHMPPKGKSQLTKPEIDLIHWWIREGRASETVKVAEVVQSDTIAAVLAHFTGVTATDSVVQFNELPDGQPGDLQESQLSPLRQAGLIVSRFSPGSPFVTVNCVNVPGFDDSQVDLLLSIADHVVWLKLGSTRITDKGLQRLDKLTNLTRLSLEHTAITDEGLAVLGSFKHLVYLNLVGTRVTDRGLPPITKLERLRSVYFWKSKVTANGANAVKARLPHTDVNLGEAF